MRRLREEMPTGTWKRGFEGVRYAAAGGVGASVTSDEEGAEASEQKEEEEVKKETCKWSKRWRLGRASMTRTS
jgi:hypothetical protein